MTLTNENQNIQEIQSIVIKAKDFYKAQKFIESYQLYKSIYRKFNDLRVIPNLIDIAFISTKKNFLQNKKLKFKLIDSLIKFGLNKDKKTPLTNELYYLNLKLLREFKKNHEFKIFYEALESGIKKILFIQFEYFHHLLETDQFEAAEKILGDLKLNRRDYYKNLDYFFIDKKSFDFILDNNSPIKHEIVYQKNKIESLYNYIVVVSGTYEIFNNEILRFLNSLKKNAKSYLISILIHDASEQEIKNICSEIEHLNITNFLLIFENSKSFNFDNIETKSYYTARRYLLVDELMKKYNEPVFIFDADSIICKDLNQYLEMNKNFDMTLHIKEELRYFQTSITANQSLFINTNNSKIFLKFYTKYVSYIINNKKIRWHIDQIILYVAYVYIKRFKNGKINNNSNNNHKNSDSYFYHTFHNKYLI